VYRGSGSWTGDSPFHEARVEIDQQTRCLGPGHPVAHMRDPDITARYATEAAWRIYAPAPRGAVRDWKRVLGLDCSQPTSCAALHNAGGSARKPLQYCGDFPAFHEADLPFSCGFRDAVGQSPAASVPGNIQHPDIIQH
jgi:hypothetical protein